MLHLAQRQLVCQGQGQRAAGAAAGGASGVATGLAGGAASGSQACQQKRRLLNMGTEQDKVKGSGGCGCCLKSCFLCLLRLLSPSLPSPLHTHTHSAIKTANKTNAQERNTRQQAASSTGNSPSPTISTCTTSCIIRIRATWTQPSERVNSQQLSSQRRKRYVRTFFMQESAAAAASIGLARAEPGLSTWLTWPGVGSGLARAGGMTVKRVLRR